MISAIAPRAFRRRILRGLLPVLLPVLAITGGVAQYPASTPAKGAASPASTAKTTGPMAAPKNAPIADPTRPSPRVKAALTAQGSGLSETTLRGLVLAGGKEGAVMLEIKGAGQVLARPGVPFNVLIDGASRKLVIKSITTDGVELEAPLLNETVLIPSLGPANSRTPGSPSEMQYVEFRDLGLRDALRMLADQSGENYSASASASKMMVNTVLRNLSANTVVEELCKSHNLWYKQDASNGITRIMTMEEFERDLIGFREDKTEVFTLLYPNVNEVALAIADLYGDRVQLSLDDQDQDRDADDLESRFDRFDILNRRSQSGAGGSFGGNTLVDGYNGVNSYNGSGGGGYTSGGYGNSNGSGNSNYRGNRGSNSSYGRNNRYDNRGSSNNRNGTAGQNDDLYQNLTPDQAQRLDRALSVRNPGAEAEATVQALRQKPATIFVTARRRNNMVAVRTADPRVIDEIRNLVRQLDTPTPMVLLEVKVLSVELGNDFHSVFDYQFSDGTTGGAFSQGNIELPQPGGALLGGAGLRSSDMTFVVVSKNFRARMQLLEDKNRVKSLAAPILLTANNEVSRLFLGEERPLVRNITSQTIITERNVATTPNTNIEFRPVGNTLLITPNINSDRTVTLRLLQENSFINPGGANIPVVNSNANGSSNVQNVAVDVVATRSVSGTFVAKDGMAVAIGGLIEDSSLDKRAQIPWLGRVPGLGFFFRRQDKAKTRKELVIMIRPYVISTPADAQRISRTVLKDLSSPEIKKRLDERLMPLAGSDPLGLPEAAPTPVRPRIVH